MRIKIIPNKPAMLLKGRSRILLVADLHIGMIEFYDKKIIEKLTRLVESVKADEVIVLGDLKHRIGKFSKLEKLFNGFDIPLAVVKGNHDGKLEGFEVFSSRGITIGNIGLFHGHAKPSDDVMQSKIIIFAHAHPSILIPDDVGGSKERAWLFGEFEGKKVVVMPAFNDLCASTAVNVERPAGVMFKNWDYKNADALLLDGTYLGKVELLKPSHLL